MRNIYQIESSDVTETYKNILTYLNNLYFGTYEGKDVETSIYEQLKNSLKSEDIAWCVGSYYMTINYDPDHFISTDFPQSADITLYTTFGDCEDYARLGSVILSALNYKPSIIIMLKDTGSEIQGHAVCTMFQNGTYYVFDISKYYTGKTLEEALSYFGTKYDTFFKYDFDISKKVTERVTESKEKILRVKGNDIEGIAYGVPKKNLSGVGIVLIVIAIVALISFFI